MNRIFCCDDINLWMKDLLSDYKKEILVSYLNNQMRDLHELTQIVENQKDVDVEMIRMFFNERVKGEKRILKALKS